MSPTRWVLPRALSLSLLAAVIAAGTASAQYYDPALRALDLSTGQVARSPRLLGMGGLSLVIPDRDNQTNLWDFGGIPVGLASDDSTSSLDVRPGTHSLSSARVLPLGLERQNLAARSTVLNSEAVYRNRETGSVFGVVGDLSGLRWDQPYSNDVERRQGLLHPEFMAVLGGKLPRFFDKHVAWAANLRFRNEHVEEQYRSIIRNAAGDWIGLGGTQLDPPSEFTPTDTRSNSSAYGFSTAYSMGKTTSLALGIEHEQNRIKGTNELARSTSEVTEDRPYWIGQASLVGHFGKGFEYGVTGTGRLSDSEQDYRFTTSAGVGGIALTGRGNLLTREEKASDMQARFRWMPGKAVLSGSVVTAAHKITIDPPNANDATSLNRFINTAFNRDGADSLALPDSIGHVVSRRWAFGFGGGASYPIGRNMVGVEYHWARDARDASTSGVGPRRIAWDVRAGLERPLGNGLAARLGYQFRNVDEDDYLTGNEYTANAFTLGLGYQPTGTRWSFESGYRMEFRNQDFEDPNDEHQSRQNLAMQLHWSF